MTVDGFGFGTLTGESCLKNVHCHMDRASWDAILVTVVAFGALMWKTCAQSHRFGLGRVGGGGKPLGGGGGRRTENRDHICYDYGIRSARPSLASMVRYKDPLSRSQRNSIRETPEDISCFHGVYPRSPIYADGPIQVPPIIAIIVS